MHSAGPRSTRTPGRLAAALLTAGLLAGSALAAAAPAGAAPPKVIPYLCMNHSDPSGFSADIPPGTVIEPDTTYGGGAYGNEKLVMQGDGNLVLYLTDPRTPTGPVLWSSGTWGHLGAYAVMQTDGNFVVYEKGRSGPAGALWATGTWRAPAGTGAVVNCLGQFEVYTNGTWYRDVWSSGGGNPDNGSQAVTDRLDPGMRLLPGQWLASGSVWLVMQPDGNLVVHRKRDGAALWSSRTWGNPGAYAVQQQDGNLVVYGPGGGALWSSGTWNQPGAHLLVQDDANAVVYGPGGGALWATGTYGQG
ncbi:hypothetical protein LN042_20375 [Kitasatospora sp. RB6PN24]|uniref:hypothetical protein n=1 Tax=Kitasatospora humi TaxID=2893891 RepID=UPI001E4705D5|nr:hypothetical protein [Kitasatospora humi]MCC9309409.1 hypothetical protein [Kitasatospora humi]